MTRYQWWDHAAYPAELLLEGCFNHETAQRRSSNSRQGISDENMMHIKSPFDWRDALPGSAFTLTHFLVSSPGILGLARVHCCSTAEAILPSFRYIFSEMSSGAQNGWEQTSMHKRTGSEKNDTIIEQKIKFFLHPPIASVPSLLRHFTIYKGCQKFQYLDTDLIQYIHTRVQNYRSYTKNLVYHQIFNPRLHRY